MEIMEWVSRYGIYMSMLVILLEYACLPISSEVILPLAGIIAQREGYNLIYVIVLSTFFGIIGSLICYVIGYLSRKIFKKDPKKNINNVTKFSSLLCRLIPITRTYISFYQGLKGEKIFRFIFLSLIGILIWNGCLISLGYFIGNNKELINIIIEKYKYFILIIVIFLTLKLTIKYYKNSPKH